MCRRSLGQILGRLKAADHSNFAWMSCRGVGHSGCHQIMDCLQVMTRHERTEMPLEGGRPNQCFERLVGIAHPSHRRGGFKWSREGSTGGVSNEHATFLGNQSGTDVVGVAADACHRLACIVQQRRDPRESDRGRSGVWYSCPPVLMYSSSKTCGEALVGGPRSSEKRDSSSRAVSSFAPGKNLLMAAKPPSRVVA